VPIGLRDRIAGMGRARVSIQTEDFDLSAEVDALRRDDAQVGAVAAFVGTVRDRSDAWRCRCSNSSTTGNDRACDRVDDRRRPAAVRDSRGARHPSRRAAAPKDQIVLVAVTSAHRREAFQACEFLMDYLKTQAPFWKKQTTPRARAGSTRGSATTPRWRVGASR